jgi:hypothetical protein
MAHIYSWGINTEPSILYPARKAKKTLNQIRYEASTHREHFVNLQLNLAVLEGKKTSEAAIRAILKSKTNLE